MATRLKSTLKRELNIRGVPYMLTLSPDGLKLVVKGKRKGQKIAWADLVSGDAALAVALNASLAQTTPLPDSRPKARQSTSRRKPPRTRT